MSHMTVKKGTWKTMRFRLRGGHSVYPTINSREGSFSLGRLPAKSVPSLSESTGTHTKHSLKDLRRSKVSLLIGAKSSQFSAAPFFLPQVKNIAL